MIVTIDGPAGSGKSTAACGLAERLHFHFLDTGAMYRVVGWTCLQQEIELDNHKQVAEAARHVVITFSGKQVFANGQDVTEFIRQEDVSRVSSVVAMNPDVRNELEKQQRHLAIGLDIVTEGRDQGTVVFPNADCKFFLTADPHERAVRRQAELQTKGTNVAIEEIVQQIHDRDERDANRKISPLRRADDAVLVETSRMTPEEVLTMLESVVDAKRTKESRGISDRA